MTTTTANFPSVLFQLLQYSRQCPSFSAHRAVLMTKTFSIFPAFSSRFVDFAIQFCFCYNFLSIRSDARVKFDIGMIFLATNEIASFVQTIDYIEWLFTCLLKWAEWAKGGFHILLKYLFLKKLYLQQFVALLYKTNRFHVAVHLFSNRSQKMSKCGKNISDTLSYALCVTFLFLPHFDVICDLLLK